MKSSPDQPMVGLEASPTLSKNTACPYHRALNSINRFKSNLKANFSITTLWDRIQLAKKVSVSIIVLLSLAFCISFNNTFALISFYLPYLQTISLSLLGLTITFFLLKKYSPDFQFLINLAPIGIRNFYRAYFKSFDSIKDYKVYKSMILWGKEKLIVRNENLAAAILEDHQTYQRVSIGEKEYLPFNKYCVLGAGTGKKWLKYRKAFSSYFSTDYQADMPKVEELAKRAVSNWKKKGSINLLEELYNLIVEIRGEVFFQTSFGCLDNSPSQENFAKVVHEVLQAPTFILQGNPNEIVDKFHKRVLEAIHNSNKPGSPGYICKTKLETGEFSQKEAIQNASMFILAQAPTMVLFWVLLRAAQEGTGKELANNPKYLIQCIKEELRIHPAVPTIFARKAQKDSEIGNLKIKKGTKTMISPLFIHQNANKYNKPEAFQPEQWKVNKVNAQEILNSQNNTEGSEIPSACPFSKFGAGLKSLPFGHGKHRCQGRKYAVEEIYTICQVVFQNLNLSLQNPTDLLNQPVAHQTQMHVYNCPKEDVKLNIS